MTAMIQTRLLGNWCYLFVCWVLVIFHGIRSYSCRTTTHHPDAREELHRGTGSGHPLTNETLKEEFLETQKLASKTMRPEKSPENRNTGSTEGFINHFLQIVNQDHFIDKSLLIEALFDNSSALEPILITAPPGFGKSVNLAMIYSFFNTPVSASGIKKPPSESPTARKFIDRKLKITGWASFSTLFGSRGVLYLDFEKLSSFYSLLEFRSRFYSVLRSSIDMHPFLQLLKDTTTKNFVKRCYDAPIERHKKQSSLIVCLDKFARILNKFFGNPVLVLIDGATTPHQWILSQQASRGGPWLTNAVIHEILDFTESAKAKLIKGNWFVWKSVLTGVMSFGEEDNLYANNLQYRPALRDECLKPFYGFLGEEVDQLIALQPPTSRDTLKKNTEHYFNGYRYFHYYQDLSEDSLYCPHHIIHYLIEGKHNDGNLSKAELSSYWSPRPLHDFKYLLSPARFGKKFLDSLDPTKGVKIFGTTKLDSVALIALVEAERGIGNPAEHIEDVLFYNLMEQGFYILKEEQGDSSWLLTVPNKAVEFAMRVFAERIVNPFLIGPS